MTDLMLLNATMIDHDRSCMVAYDPYSPQYQEWRRNRNCYHYLKTLVVSKQQ